MDLQVNGNKKQAARAHRTTRQCIRVPADILSWPVGYTSRKVYVGLLVFQLRARKHSGRILKTYEEIAALCGIKDAKTIAASIRELADAGYIQVKTHMYWSEDDKKLHRGTNEYTILPASAPGSHYIWLPVKLLAARISPAAFSVLLFLLHKQGRNTRSWPSLRRGFQTICQKNGSPMPRKTVCAALQQLRCCMMLIVLRCVKRNQASSMNTYMLTVWGDWSACNAAPKNISAADDPGRGGGYFFGGLPVKTKITYRFIKRRKEIGVFEFVGSSKKTSFFKRRRKTSRSSRPHNMDTG